MGRLIRKIISRLKRKILSAWQPIDINGPDVVQIITDAMAAATQIQIEYQGSGWRLILPYGWNTSKDGNILLMCYKDTGEIRSYRLDRVLQVLVDDTLLNQPSSSDNGMLEVTDYNASPEDFEIPLLPNIDEILEESENEVGQKLPYDEGLDYLSGDTPIEDEIPKEEISEDIPEEQIPEQKDLEENPEKEVSEEKEDIKQKEDEEDETKVL